MYAICDLLLPSLSHGRVKTKREDWKDPFSAVSQSRPTTQPPNIDDRAPPVHQTERGPRGKKRGAGTPATVDGGSGMRDDYRCREN